MRKMLDTLLLDKVLQELGHIAQGPGHIYLTGGACALLLGWRQSTVDIALKLDPEPKGIFEGIRNLKQRLDVNIELASPSDFIPELPNWRERSVFINTYSRVSFYHYDFYSQALSKIERGHDRDLKDVEQMCKLNLIQKSELLDYFNKISPQILRYPSLDETIFKQRVLDFINIKELDS